METFGCLAGPHDRLAQIASPAPNLAADGIRVSFSGSLVPAAVIELRDVMGRVVGLLPVTETGSVDISMARLDAGTYSIGLRPADGRVVERAQVVKQ